MSDTTLKIKKILEKLSDPRNVDKIMRERQSRLKSLVLKWGVHDVALAAGYTVSTLSQYMRVTNPRNIGEESVAQAEAIFKSIK